LGGLMLSFSISIFCSKYVCFPVVYTSKYYQQNASVAIFCYLPDFFTLSRIQVLAFPPKSEDSDMSLVDSIWHFSRLKHHTYPVFLQLNYFMKMWLYTAKTRVPPVTFWARHRRPNLS
jgi:hypothetical protein